MISLTIKKGEYMSVNFNTAVTASAGTASAEGQTKTANEKTANITAASISALNTSSSSAGHAIVYQFQKKPMYSTVNSASVSAGTSPKATNVKQVATQTLAGSDKTNKEANEKENSSAANSKTVEHNDHHYYPHIPFEKKKFEYTFCSAPQNSVSSTTPDHRKDICYYDPDDAGPSDDEWFRMNKHRFSREAQDWFE